MLWTNKLTEFGQSARFYGREEVKLAEFVQKKSVSSDKIYLLGSHSLIYVLSERTPPKPWIENYVWHFEIPGLQESQIEGFEKEKPSLILWTEPKKGNWYDLATYQPEKITNWIKENYSNDKEVIPGTFLWLRN